MLSWPSRLLLIRKPAICHGHCGSLDFRLHRPLSLGTRASSSKLSNSFNGRPSRQSSRKLRSRRKSPSPALIDAARTVGLHEELIVAAYRKRIDLSYVSVKERAQKKSLVPQIVRHRESTKQDWLTLQAILTTYILHLKQLLNDANAASDWLSPEHAELLKSRGYTADDVWTWASMYCETSIDLAATRLLAQSGAIVDENGNLPKPLPGFLALQLLRRKHFTPAALRSLLIYTSYEIERKKNRLMEYSELGQESQVIQLSTTMDSSTLLILLIRLLRHARMCWPEALPTVAKLFADFMALEPSKTTRRKNVLGRITQHYILMLRLLSLPSGVVPFHSVAYQQRAQFDLVQKMAEHVPPLPVTEAGYRAITSVQLANKKTTRERDWDSLKLKSWPPWKEDKTGLDAEKGIEYGTSRAQAVLNRAREAGYFASTWSAEAWAWDRSAGILAGWDFDGSPTIQTRTFLPYPRGRRRAKRKQAIWSTGQETLGSSIWAARIRATRTIQEAWACFLVMGDQHHRPDMQTYFAMLEKLAYPPNVREEEQNEHHEARTLKHDREPLSAGDHKETMPDPISPKETTYVRIQPPSFHQLATEMYQQGIYLNGYRLTFLLRHAPSFSHGLKYLEWTSQALPEYSCLFSHDIQDSAQLRYLSPMVVAAFIQFLCRFPYGDGNLNTTDTTHQNLSPEPVPKRSIAGLSPLKLAFRILRANVTPDRPKWLAVLATLNLQNSRVDRGSSKSVHTYYMRRWHLMKEFYSEMIDTALEPDAASFLLMCKGLENATLSARALLAEVTRNPSTQPLSSHHTTAGLGITRQPALADTTIEATELLETAPNYIRSIFHQAMGTGRATLVPSLRAIPANLPRLLSSPNAPTLHAYVRVLGLLQDWQGLHDLVRWMVKYQPEIAAAVDMPRHGPRILRRTIVALRVFLEASWKVDESGVRRGGGKEDNDVAPLRILMAVKRQVEGVEAWGGWPGDEECEEYVYRGRFPQ